MIRLLLLSSLLLVPFLSATSQVPRDAAQGTWEHTFEDREPTETVYLRFNGDVLEVWRVSEDEDCGMFPSVVDWDGQEISLGSQFTWSIASVDDDKLRVDFPNGQSVRYQRARLNPRNLCGGRDI